MSTARVAKTLEVCESNFHKLREQAEAIAQAGDLAAAALKAGGHLFFCGNGGSAADAQHLAAELIGRFWKKERPALAATALHANTSTLTALGNDYSYDIIFSRQIEGLAKKGDVLFALSTSGNSKNVVKAVETAKAMGLKTIAITGRSGGKLKALCDRCLCMPSDETPRIQEMTITAGHIICSVIDDDF